MKLSDFELDVLQLFFQHGQLSAPQAHRQIETDRDVTYSTVKTIIDRLEEKQALVRVEQHGRTIIYAAAVKPESLQKPLMGEFIQRVFGGNRRPLFSHLLADESLSDDDLKYLERLLRARKKANQEPKQ